MVIEQRNVEHEAVWLDGSGVEGTYRVYGHLIAASHCGDRNAVASVRVLNAREYGHRSGRERGTCKTACEAVATRVNDAMAEVWAAGREYREVA